MSISLSAQILNPGTGLPVANGSVIITLNTAETVIATGLPATSSYTINLDANGILVATVNGNNELTPPSSYYNATIYSAPNGGGSILYTAVWIVGPSQAYSGTLFPNIAVLPTFLINVGNISATGSPSSITFLRGDGTWQNLSGIGIAGDVTGTLFTTNVAKLQGRAVSSSAPSNGQILAWSGTAWTPTSLVTRVASLNYVIDGGGSPPSVGSVGQLSVPVNCTLTGWVITADVGGSAVIDVLRSTYAAFPTTSSIAGTDKPTLSSAQKNEDLVLSGWGSTALNAGDQLQFSVVSATTVSRLNLTLNVTIP